MEAHGSQLAAEQVVSTVAYLRWIPLLPFLGMLFHAAVGARAGRKAVNIVACGTLFGAFALAVRAFMDLRAGAASVVDPVYRWIEAGGLTVDVTLVVDPLSALMCLVVTGVGFLIHVYSTGYMAHEPDHARYFAYLNLFTASMLVLVLADSLPLMFVGWEGVGLCSYLLIGFWYTDPAKADAGKKAFVANRVGDAAFIIGMAVLFWAMVDSGHGTLRFAELNAAAASLPTGVALTAALLLFVGATGKSAQIPLFVWLPDAMAGPTPVSALIHAATMVTAGVYMVARLNGLYVAAPQALEVVATIGALTAFGAASVALVQNDIKKVLAYSTVSQLGYMFLALGVGAFGAAVFHVMTHAFFKALLFLGAGSVIHGLHEEQDIRRMGGLRKKMPVTMLTFLAGTLAIAGVPGLAGFFSKDEILALTFASGSYVLWALAMATAAMTAFYMMRLFVLTFLGEFRGDHHKFEHAHESPASMTGPLVVLAVLSVVGGYLGVPAVLGGSNLLGHFLEPVVGHPAAHLSHSTELGLMGMSITESFVAIAAAWFIYSRFPRADEGFAARARGLYGLLTNAYYVDRTYDRALVDGSVRVGDLLWKRVDVGVIDALANATAASARSIGGAWRGWAGGNVQGYALSLFVGVVLVLLAVWAGAGS
jgi:NADH-quinone oxidoreductase subunit L